MAARCAMTDTRILADCAVRRQKEGIPPCALAREVGVGHARVRLGAPRLARARRGARAVDIALPRCNVSRGDSFNSGGSAARGCAEPADTCRPGGRTGLPWTSV